MASLLDIVPLKKTVKIGELVVEVKGITAREIGNLLQKFPELRVLIVGGELTWDNLISMAPLAAETIIAYGAGFAGNTVAEASIASLPIEAQIDLLEAVSTMTFKKGFGPFMQRLKAMERAMEPVPPEGANTTKAPALKSEQPSKPSSTEDTPKKASGIKPPAS